MPVTVEAAPPLPGLPPVAGRPLIARVDGGQLSSDGGLLALRGVGRRPGIADRLAARIDDPRPPEWVRHALAAVLRFRMLMIAAGHGDGNDADGLRHGPASKPAPDHLLGGAAPCSQPTISRLGNLPDVRALPRMARAMVGLCCASFRQVPRRVVLDVDGTFDAVHGGRQLRLLNAHHGEYGFRPTVALGGEGRPVAAMLRPARRPTGAGARTPPRRPVRGIRGRWPGVEILIRADGHRCAPEALDLCRAHGLDFLPGVASTTTLRRHVEALERSTAARRAAEPGTDKPRRHKEFPDGARGWSRVERIIARAEAGPQGAGTRFAVTSLAGGTPRRAYEDLCRARGQAEDHAKARKRHLAADRTPCVLRTAACWLLWPLRGVMPKRPTWRVAQSDTLRLRLAKPATRVVALKTRVMPHLPGACPGKAILRLALERMPRLTC